MQLIRRFSARCVLAEELEARLARGEEIVRRTHALVVLDDDEVGAANRHRSARQEHHGAETCREYTVTSRQEAAE